MLTCGVCGGRSTSPLMCAVCGRSWDRARARVDAPAVDAMMRWAAKRARRAERLRVRDEVNAQGHKWTHPMYGASGGSYATCKLCGVTFLAVTDLSSGHVVLRLQGVGGSDVLVGRTGKMPQCRGAQGGPRG